MSSDVRLVEAGIPSASARFGGALLLGLPLVPIVSSLSTAAMAIVHAGAGNAGPSDAAWGASAGILSWGLASVQQSRFMSAGALNQTQFSSIQDRIMELRSRIDALASTHTPDAGAGESLNAATALLRSRSVLAWLHASGYNAVWKRLHHSAELLSLAEGDDDVRQAAFRVLLRLLESSITTKAEMLRRLDQAFGEPPWWKSLSGTGRLGASPRGVLLEVSQAVDEFRDGRWDGIIRQRNQLIDTIALLGAFAYGLLVFGALSSVVRGSAILAAIVYFLVGGAVGLLNRGESDAGTDTAVEDFGLTRARLVLLPLASGLAGVLGVVFVGSLNTQAVDLGRLFDLQQQQGSLLVAAASGLAPKPLLDRLTKQAEQYKADVQSTEAADGRTRTT